MEQSQFQTLVVLGPILGLTLAASTAQAQTTLDLEVLSSGDATVFVQAGDTVDYAVQAELGGAASQGLAMFAFDLVYDGGALTQADAPTAGPLLQFVAPLGLNNPAGYGGTVRGGDLIQVGGAMNTINNQFAPQPSGSVITGIADGAAVELATGSFVAPTSPGTYTLRAQNLFANALESQAPAGHWVVAAVESGSVEPLTVVVLDCGATTYCSSKVASVGCVPAISSSGSASLGGSAVLTLVADDVVNRQIGVFVVGTEAASDPVFGATLCVGGSVSRLIEPALSGGSGPAGSNCDGSFTRVIDSTFLVNSGFGLGDQVYCQWVFRDPAHADGTGAGLTNAAAFVVCP